MIQPVKAYKASDGTLCESVEEVQRREVYLLLQGPVNAIAVDYIDQKISDAPTCAAHLMDAVLEHRDKLVDILTTGPRSRPARRTINGATTKKRKAKPAATSLAGPTSACEPVTAEQAAAGFAAAHAAVEEAA